MAPVDPWFPFRSPKPDPRLRLFCLPPSGGGASLYRAWGPLISKDIELCAVQPPGREGRIAEPAISDTRQLVEAVRLAITPLLNKPFAIFGHSVGGWVGFELVRALRKNGQPQPIHLFVSAIGAPHVPNNSGSHLMNDAKLIEFLRIGGGYPEEILASAEVMQMLFPTIRADACLSELYEYVEGEPLDCPITGFIGDKDVKFTRDEILGWKTYTRKQFRAIDVVGNHGFLVSAYKKLIASVDEALRP